MVVTLYVPLTGDERVVQHDSEVFGDVARIWQQAALKLRQADGVVIIGYSFPETDLMSWELMDEATKSGKIRVTLVDPSPDGIVQRLKSRLGRRIELEVKAMGFKQFAASLHKPTK